MIGMREILKHFANVSRQDVVGMRAPFLKPGRNAQFAVSDERCTLLFIKRNGQVCLIKKISLKTQTSNRSPKNYLSMDNFILSRF